MSENCTLCIATVSVLVIFLTSYFRLLCYENYWDFVTEPERLIAFLLMGELAPRILLPKMSKYLIQIVISVIPHNYVNLKTTRA